MNKTKLLIDPGIVSQLKSSNPVTIVYREMPGYLLKEQFSQIDKTDLGMVKNIVISQDQEYKEFLLKSSQMPIELNYSSVLVEKGSEYPFILDYSVLTDDPERK